MPADSARQDDLFEIATLLDEVLNGIAMGNAHDILLDDGTVVEFFGDVVAGRADQLHAPLERLVVGLGAPAYSGPAR